MKSEDVRGMTDDELSTRLLELKREHVRFLLVPGVRQADGEAHRIVCRQMKMLAQLIELTRVRFVQMKHKHVSHEFSF